jgi:hypothetical protein
VTDTVAEVGRSRLVRGARRLGAACVEGWRASYARAVLLRVAGELKALDWPDQIRMVGCAGLSALATGAALSGLAPESRPWAFRAAWLLLGAAAALCALAPRVAARLLMRRAAGSKE